MSFNFSRFRVGYLGILLLFCLAGCEPDGPAEETGENIDEAAEELEDAGDELTD